jgi:ADP-ribose pyrophosphatase
MSAPVPERPVAASLGWQVRSTRYLHRAKWFNVRQDLIVTPEGTEGQYTFVEHPGSVFVVPLLRDGRIVLIRSFRYPLDAWCWEVPAGGLGDKPGSSPEAVAIEELAEEAGMTCDRLVVLGSLWLGNGQSRHRAVFYLAQGASQSAAPRTEALEIIDRRAAFTPDEAVELMTTSGDGDGDSLLAVLLARRFTRAEGLGGGHA